MKCKLCGSDEGLNEYHSTGGSKYFMCWNCASMGQGPQARPSSTPQSEQNEVAPELKQRFSDWVDQRTEKGVATYGEPLMTHNGRDAERDMTEELLDFCQYQQQHIMEAKDSITKLTWANREFLKHNNELKDALKQSWAHSQKLKDQADYLERALLTINGPHWEMMA